jgi:hypothetical protein
VARALDAPLAGALLARPPARHPRPRAVDPRVPGTTQPAAPRPVLLKFQIGGEEEELSPDGIQRILDCAAACSVADLCVDSVHHAFGFLCKLRLPRGDPHLTRLTVGGIRVGLSKPFFARSHTFSVVEVISLRGVTLSDRTVENVVAASPLLRTLELCYCDGLGFVSVAAAGTQLRSLTIAECSQVGDISTMEASTVRSFRYSGSYIHARRIPATCELANLYILDKPAGFARPAYNASDIK